MLSSRFLALAVLACSASALAQQPRPYAPELYSRDSLLSDRMERRVEPKPYAPELLERSSLEAHMEGGLHRRSVAPEEQKRGEPSSAAIEKRGEGVRCHGHDAACKDDLFCSLISDVCRQKSAEGGKCQIDAGCAKSMSCVNKKCRKTGHKSQHAPPTKIGHHQQLWPSGHPSHKKHLSFSHAHPA